MSFDFDNPPGLEPDQAEEVNQAAAIHAAYWWRLVKFHDIPHQIAAGFTETFMELAIVDPED